MSSPGPGESNLHLRDQAEGGSDGHRASENAELLRHAAPSLTTQMEGLVDMLAWIRIELAANHPGASASIADRDRIHRALVQLQMALAMAKELANELRLLRAQS
jgi:hypothetical protein